MWWSGWWSGGKGMTHPTEVETRGFDLPPLCSTQPPKKQHQQHSTPLLLLGFALFAFHSSRRRPTGAWSLSFDTWGSWSRMKESTTRGIPLPPPPFPSCPSMLRLAKK